MFKDYSQDIELLKDSMKHLVEKMEQMQKEMSYIEPSIKWRIDDIEKDIYRTLSAVNDIKKYLGLEETWNLGKYHEHDLETWIENILKEDPNFKAEGIYIQIEPYLMENDGIETGYEYMGHLMVHEDKKKIEEYNKWSALTKHNWMNKIEKIREKVKLQKEEK